MNQLALGVQKKFRYVMAVSHFVQLPSFDIDQNFHLLTKFELIFHSEIGSHYQSLSIKLVLSIYVRTLGQAGHSVPLPLPIQTLFKCRNSFFVYLLELAVKLMLLS